MPIIATNPTTIPASAAKTFDRWWLNMSLVGQQRPYVNVILRKYRVAEDGSNEFSPVDPDVVFNVPDLLLVAAQRAASGKPSLANAVQSLIDAAQELGVEQGLI